MRIKLKRGEFSWLVTLLLAAMIGIILLILVKGLINRGG